MLDSYDHLFSTKQARELDRRALAEHAVAGGELMERAGEAAFRLLRRQWPACDSLTVFCGSGNNGGDGYVIGRLARQAAMRVNLYAVGGNPKPESEAAAARARFMTAGGDVLGPAVDYDTRPAVVVDALLGTGLDRPVEGEYLRAIAAIATAGSPVLAVDIPSGLNADTGAEMGACVSATETVTFIARKRGLYTGAGPQRCGKITYAPLGLPAALFEGEAPTALLARLAPLRRLWLPPRSRVAHKGDAGRVLVIGGNHGYAGAALLAATAAQRVGAGLVTLATQPEHISAIVSHRPEIMAHAVTSAKTLDPLLRAADVVAIGPGLGRDDWAKSLFSAVLERSGPAVIDADALNLLTDERAHSDAWVLTPHPGEASRLLGRPVAQVQRDRFSAVRELVERYGGVGLLKGAGTLIAAQGKVPVVCKYGNPGMASGGMGDLLTGIIAGLIAQGLDTHAASVLGACLHGRAGDIAARSGERGLLAGDLLDPLRGLCNGLDDEKDPDDCGPKGTA